MENNYWENIAFDNKIFAETPLNIGEYVDCRFVNCNFSGSDLSRFVFDRCHFETCNLSSAKLNQCAMREVSFSNCKMLGLLFDTCNPFLFSILCEGCALNLSSFYKMNLKNIKFNNCSLQEVDFSETDLSAALFNDCDLTGAIFDNSILEKSDFRTARNFSINPEKNRLRKTKFSHDGLSGLLSHLDILIE